ncbi:DnaJ domain-containing protein [Anaerocolumna xylanovorans]|uniref:DnaJ domain-containing protein n=1 Tax=Anaerocolumna xylanovorans DSM 12503 TaxID=1121345 RepID=A0A1M7YMY1_9FIRM|nr:DnaJ domain-containing protein [Anaerocolumna xylanovorans]SHO54013.1 DnaJ domain-containing protein [Anaerocolumna xylanovorans DSM 12503]
MSDCYCSEGDIKRKIRNLKKMELKLRFHQYEGNRDYKGWEIHKSLPKALVWDEFFGLQDKCRKARYNMKDLLAMDRENLKQVIGQYYYAVYYKIFQETGILDGSLYNPDVLAKMGLSFDADARTIKKRFRELAKEYHPDAGGSSDKFVELLEQMDSLHLKD